jgi:hypothetical protein
VGGLPKAVEDFYQQLQYKNRVMFLTGSYNTYQQLIENGKRLRAIRAIKSNLASMSGGNNQVQSQQAQQLEENITQHFYSAVRETFTRLIWPIRPQGDAAQSLFPQEFYMKFEGNNYRGEQQIIQLLREKQKYTEDITTDNFRQKIELRLFTQPQMDWGEIERRAASQTVWQWHLNGALADFRQRMVSEGQWREYGAVVAKGPFTKERLPREIHKSRTNLSQHSHITCRQAGYTKRLPYLSGLDMEVEGWKLDAKEVAVVGEVQHRQVLLALLLAWLPVCHPHMPQGLKRRFCASKMLIGFT